MIEGGSAYFATAQVVTTLDCSTFGCCFGKMIK